MILIGEWINMTFSGYVNQMHISTDPILSLCYSKESNLTLTASWYFCYVFGHQSIYSLWFWAKRMPITNQKQCRSNNWSSHSHTCKQQSFQEKVLVSRNTKLCQRGAHGQRYLIWKHIQEKNYRGVCAVAQCVRGATTCTTQLAAGREILNLS